MQRLRMPPWWAVDVVLGMGAVVLMYLYWNPWNIGTLGTFGVCSRSHALYPSCVGRGFHDVGVEYVGVVVSGGKEGKVVSLGTIF